MLEDLAIKSKIVELESERSLPEELPEDTDLPVMRDDEELYEGAEAIADRLDELKVFKEWWYKFQSDACYCDESGEVITEPESGETDR
jgi:hypothetical protein